MLCYKSRLTRDLGCLLSSPDEAIVPSSQITGVAKMIWAGKLWRPHLARPCLPPRWKRTTKALCNGWQESRTTNLTFAIVSEASGTDTKMCWKRLSVSRLNDKKHTSDTIYECRRQSSQKHTSLVCLRETRVIQVMPRGSKIETHQIKATIRSC